MSIPFEKIASELLARSESLCRQWLPAGKREGKEWRVGNLKGEAGHSLSINLATGIWKDFATDETGGDLIALYAAINNLSQADAAKELAPSHLLPANGNGNGNGHHAPAAFIPKAPSIPNASALYRYTDTFWVARFGLPNGKKSFTPLTWDGREWQRKAPPTPRPLYGLEELAAYPERTVMVVEGEKTRDAAAPVLEAYVTITWHGGASATQTADWSPLKGRNVILWADADEPGHKAMTSVAQTLLPIAAKVRLVLPDDTKPAGWDLADAISGGWSYADIMAYGKELICNTTAEVPRETVSPLKQYKNSKEREAAELAAAYAEQQKLALRPLMPKRMSEIIKGTYEEKVPIFEGVLYPGAWLIVGRPKIGKSWILLQMALSLAENGYFLGWKCCVPNAEVLMIAAEDDYGRIQGRLRALGHASAPDSCYVIPYDEFMLIAAARSNFQSFAEFIDQFLTEHPLCKLVIIDTETTTRQTWTGEQTKRSQDRITDTDYKQVREMDRVGLKHGAVIGLVNHAAKRKGEWVDIHELINRTGTAFAGASGSMVLADPQDADPMDPSAKSRILGFRGRDLKDDIMILVEQGKDMPLFENKGKYVEVIANQTHDAIMNALEEMMPDIKAGEYATAQEIGDAIGKSRAAVQRAISRMVISGQKNYKQTWLVSTKQGKKGGIRLDKR